MRKKLKYVWSVYEQNGETFLVRVMDEQEYQLHAEFNPVTGEFSNFSYSSDTALPTITSGTDRKSRGHWMHMDDWLLIQCPGIYRKITNRIIYIAKGFHVAALVPIVLILLEYFFGKFVFTNLPEIARMGILFLTASLLLFIAAWLYFKGRWKGMAVATAFAAAGAGLLFPLWFQ